jgi:hypothetical protein
MQARPIKSITFQSVFMMVMLHIVIVEFVGVYITPIALNYYTSFNVTL